jgi:hypothetical protein
VQYIGVKDPGGGGAQEKTLGWQPLGGGSAQRETLGRQLLVSLLLRQHLWVGPNTHVGGGLTSL